MISILYKLSTFNWYLIISGLDYSRDLKAFSYIEDTFQEKSSLSSLKRFKNVLKNDCVVNLQETCNKYESALKRLSSKYKIIISTVITLKYYLAKYPNIDQFKSTVLDTLQTSHQKVFNYSNTFDEVTNSEEKQLELRRLDIKTKAMKNNTAEYRGSKSVITAMDLKN